FTETGLYNCSQRNFFGTGQSLHIHVFLPNHSAGFYYPASPFYWKVQIPTPLQNLFDSNSIVTASILLNGTDSSRGLGAKSEPFNAAYFCFFHSHPGGIPEKSMDYGFPPARECH